MKKDLIKYLYELDRELEIYNFLDTDGSLVESLTVRQLIIEVEGFAKTLHQFPVGSRALLIFPTCKSFVVAFYACIHAGIIPAPVSVPGKRNGIDNIESIYRDCDAGLIVFDRDSFLRVSDEFYSSSLRVERVIFYDQKETDISFDSVVRRKSASEIAFLQYTSGSTSSPKGVIVTHKNVAANMEMAHKRFGTTSSSIFLAWTPLHHDMGLVGNLMHPIYIGCKCYLIAPVTLLMRPKVWLSVLSDYAITITGGPNFSYKHILERVSPETLQEMNLDLSRLEVLYNGAEPIEVEVMDDFMVLFEQCGLRETAFLPCYGLAEATLILSGINFDENYRSQKISIDEGDGKSVSFEKDLEGKVMSSCGPAVSGVELRIRSQLTREVLSSNMVGVIEAKGDNISEGYWGKPKRDSLWLDTGDLGFLDDCGDLYVCGRMKDVIIFDGRNIYPQDIEIDAELAELVLAVSGFGAFGIDDEVYLVVEMSRGALRQVCKESAGKLKKSITREISLRHGVGLKDIRLVRPGSIPKTTSFKIQRQKLKQLYQSNKLNEVIFS